jgi:hypothetical protein
MKRFFAGGVTALAVIFLATADRAFAQGNYRSFGPPTVSPYINILRGGVNPAINYYGLVRPQLYFQNTLNQVQQQQLSDESTLAAQGQPGAVPVTGHISYFRNYSHYYAQGTNFRQGVGTATVGTATQGTTFARQGVGAATQQAGGQVAPPRSGR